jgi:HD-GYP domain-containing protein (c-di-GMP phosphodiesterase class II)
MHLVSINVESIRLGHPLPYPLMDKLGVLLAKIGYVIESKQDLESISKRGGGLFIDIEDSEAHHRAYVERLHGLVRDGKSLGEIADTKVSRGGVADRAELQNDNPDWLDLQTQCNSLLRDNNPPLFLERLERLHSQLSHHARRNPDGALFALIYLSATDKRMYSATHAMLVSVMCGLAAREVLNWPAPIEAILCKAALTMNIAMTELQDRLSNQVETPTPAQRAQIENHAERSAQMLEDYGVTDATLLLAIRDHHSNAPGALKSKPSAQRIARLMQRADMFAAQLAPRASRPPVAPAAAMQACYFDENRQVDEAGAALIKAVGIYQPGAFVRLTTDEVAVVIKRGSNTTTPRVAVLINRSGMPTVEPTIRDTSLREYKIIASVPHRDVKVTLNLERLLPLTAGPASERPW